LQQTLFRSGFYFEADLISKQILFHFEKAPVSKQTFSKQTFSKHDRFSERRRRISEKKDFADEGGLRGTIAYVVSDI